MLRILIILSVFVISGCTSESRSTAPETRNTSALYTALTNAARSSRYDEIDSNGTENDMDDDDADMENDDTEIFTSTNTGNDSVDDNIFVLSRNFDHTFPRRTLVRSRELLTNETELLLAERISLSLTNKTGKTPSAEYWVSFFQLCLFSIYRCLCG